MITLLVMTDGRGDCIERTVESAFVELTASWSGLVINDDSGDKAYRSWLIERFGPLGFDLVPPARERLGFGGAIRHAWAYLRTSMSSSFVFHLEDDFVFERPVDVDGMARVLVEQPHLVQVALRRQPWNDDERAAGGIVEQHPGDYTQHVDDAGHRWLEHRRFFTTNPSLYRRTLLDQEWPEGEHSEGVFTHQLLADDDLRFAFWGDRGDEPWVTHIGHQRAGVGY